MKKLTLFISTFLISLSSFAINGILVKTIDKSFQDKWYKTISSDVPKFVDSDKVYKEQIFFITTIAWEFELDKSKSADVNYSIKILKPDGSIYFEQEQLPLLNRKIQNRDHFQMSKAILEIKFEEADKLGEYKIEVLITDNISAKSKQINTAILLQELPSYHSFKIDQEEEFMAWFEKYYEAPNPEKALSYFLYYAKSPLSENDNSFLPIFSIFIEIFNKNQFLFNQVLECFNEQDERTKTYLIYLIYYADLGNEDFYNALKGFDKQVYNEINKTTLPELYGEIINPAQLDMLWATFSASGDYEPILKLIQTLEYTKHQGALEHFKTSKKTEEERQAALKNAIYDSLVWSFKSNCKQHSLVKNYSNWALKNEKLSEIQRSELKKILEAE